MEKPLASFPLAFYAAEHWVTHAKFKDVKRKSEMLWNNCSTPKDHIFGLGPGYAA
jgi:hypothetical protein